MNKSPRLDSKQGTHQKLIMYTCYPSTLEMEAQTGDQKCNIDTLVSLWLCIHHMVLKVLGTSDGWVPIPLGSGTPGKGTEYVKARRQRGLWNAIFRAQHSHCTHDPAYIISQQFQLPARDLQRTGTVKKQSLIREGIMGPHLSLLNNWLQWILGEKSLSLSRFQ